MNAKRRAKKLCGSTFINGRCFTCKDVDQLHGAIHGRRTVYLCKFCLATEKGFSEKKKPASV